MFKRLNDKDRKRLKRKVHIRKHLRGTAERPRLTVTRSNTNLYKCHEMTARPKVPAYSTFLL